MGDPFLHLENRRVMGTPCRETRRLRLLQRLFYFVAITSENNALTLKISSVLSVESASGWDISVHRVGHVFESWSHIGRILLIAHLKLWLLKIRHQRQKTRLFFASQPSQYRSWGRSWCWSWLWFWCICSRLFNCETFLLRDVQNLDFCFPVPVLSFSTQNNGFLELSPSRKSVFDNTTPPTSSCFVNAHRAVFSFGQFNSTGLHIPIPSRLNIPVWRALLQDYEDRVTCDFLEFGWPLGYTNQTLPVFDLRTHRSALTFPSAVKNISVARFPSVEWQNLSLNRLFMTALLFLLSTRWPSVTLTNEEW